MGGYCGLQKEGEINGGGGGSRTRVPRTFKHSVYILSFSFTFSLSACGRARLLRASILKIRSCVECPTMTMPAR